MKLYPNTQVNALRNVLGNTLGNTLILVIALICLLVLVPSCSSSKKKAKPNKEPSVSLTATSKTGTAPLEITFTITTSDPDGDNLTVNLDFGDGQMIKNQKQPKHTYQKAGTYIAKAVVSDGKGGSASDTVTIKVTPQQAQYRGEWVWLVVFTASGIEIAGTLSISTALADTDTMRNTEGGVWRRCTSLCANSGVMLIGETKDSKKDTYNLFTSFSNSSLNIQMLSIDKDNKLENLDGKLSFIGLGSWFFNSGNSSLIGFGMSKISDIPTDRPTSNSSVSFSIDSIKFSSEITSQSKEDWSDYIRSKLLEMLQSVE